MSRLIFITIAIGALAITFFTGFLLRDRLPQPKEAKSEVTALTKGQNHNLGGRKTNELVDGEYVVQNVLDGDTIDLTNGIRIRYEGIDAPEKNESFGLKALENNQKLVNGKKVKIEVSDSKTDAFGRTLAYVWVDNIFVNERVVEDGYATVYIHFSTRPPKYLKQLQEAEIRARQDGWGMWIEEKMKN